MLLLIKYYTRKVTSPVLRYHRNRNYRSRVASFRKDFSSSSHLVFQQRFHFSSSQITLVEQSWCMHVTVSGLANCSQGRTATNAFATKSYWCHLHVETSHLCTRDVECRIAVGPMALNASAGTTPSTHTACQAMPSWWYSLQSIDWLKKYMVCKTNFWDP